MLRAGGRLVFNVWDRIEDNEFADVVTTALAAVFPDDPPRFLARVPHGYYDRRAHPRRPRRRRLRRASPIETLAARAGPLPRESRDRLLPGDAAAQRDRGPRDASRLDEATDAAAEARDRAAVRPGAVNGKIQAHVVTAVK